MQAMIIEKFGDPDVFVKTEVPKKPCASGQVSIRVHASSVNPVDYKIRDGRGAFLCPEFPAVLHADAAGVITEVGEDVSEFSVGDEVYAFANGMMGKPGALAEYLTADANLFAKKPQSLSFEQAAALPLVTVTAWFCLIDRAEIGSGDTLLVQGGTGGVGHIALQLAKTRGSHVTVTCGTDGNCETALQLGADQAFNYTKTTAEEVFAKAPNGAGYDLVFNTPGEASIDHSVATARRDGTILDILGAFPTQPGFQGKWLTFKSVFAGRPIVEGIDPTSVQRILSQTSALVDGGEIVPLIDTRRFGFDDVGDAHRVAEAGRPIGKVVLTGW